VIGKALLRFAKISPAKLRQVVSLIRGEDVNKALAILQFTNKKGAGILEKVLKSAVANILQKDDNIDENSLFVKEVMVDDGPRWKRIRFYARGGASVIKKKTSHVTIVVESKSQTKESKKKKESKDNKGKPR
jgi:large subunit ribosomal protein L22